MSIVQNNAKLGDKGHGLGHVTCIWILRPPLYLWNG